MGAVILVVAVWFGAVSGLLVGNPDVAGAAADGHDPAAEASLVEVTNRFRAAHGLPPLAVDAALRSQARRWARHLATTSTLAHDPDLGTGVVRPWSLVGENVGRGPGVADLHAAFVASPTHRANLLDPGYTRIGVGALRGSDGRLYVVVRFLAPPGGTAPALRSLLDTLRALEPGLPAEAGGATPVRGVDPARPDAPVPPAPAGPARSPVR